MNNVSSKPLHEKIRLDLLKKINIGEYPVGTLLPKEIELALEYKVSRPTIRQSIKALVDEGYLERKQRLGTIVKQKKIRQDAFNIVESFDMDMLNKGLSPKRKVLLFKKQKVNKDIAKYLNLSKNDMIYKLIRIHYAENEPILLAITCLPEKYLTNLMEHDFSKERLYPILDKYGKGITRIWRRLEVAKADELTSELLEIKENDPIFYVHFVGYTKDQIPIEYSIHKYRGDMSSFTFTVEHKNP